MISEFTNTERDGEVTGKNPDATGDYFQVTDYNRDKNYMLEKIIQAVQFLSYNNDKSFQILYGGIVSDSGSSQIDISEGAAIGKDASGNVRMVTIPSLTNVSLPGGWNNDRQIWVIGKYAYKTSSSTRQHFIGETYHYTLADSYLGESSSADLFVDSDPGDTVVKWGSFKMNGSTFTDQNDRTRTWGLKDHDKGLIRGGLKFNSTTVPAKYQPGSYCVNHKLVNITTAAGPAVTDVFGKSRQSLDAYQWYLHVMDEWGRKRIITNYEGAVATATGNITSITGSGTAKTMTAATGTVGSHTGKILVIIGNNGFPLYFGPITGGDGATTYTFESVSTITGGASGTWTVYERIKTLHGTGSATAITTDANIEKYSPSGGENGWPSGAFAWDDDKGGYYLTASGLTNWRVFGAQPTNGSSQFSRDTISFGSGRNKNDNSLRLQTWSAYASSNTAIPIYSGPVYAKGCDYIYTSDSTLGMAITIMRSMRSVFNGGFNNGTELYNGITKNSSELSTDVNLLSDDSTLMALTVPATTNSYNTYGAILDAKPGDIIRQHVTTAASSPANPSKWIFEMMAELKDN